MDIYMEKVISAGITVLVGMGIAAFAAWIKYLVKQNKIFKKSLKAVVHDSHHHTCRDLIQKDSITEDELDNLNILHESYIALEMNGTGQRLYEEAKSKPLKCTKE